jgi:AmmeMemoRadiSam system protein B/AmmeMemoRadiSam system protein A
LLFLRPNGIFSKKEEMKRHLAVFLALFLSLAAFSLPQGIRKAVYAGAFYDGNREALAARLDGYLQNVQNLPSLSRDPQALICPHAGYVYSGQTAAFAYRLVQGKAYDTVVIIGPSHRYGFHGCSIYLQGGFETPLGVATVDEELAREIAAASGFSYVAEAQREEHSVEVQVPFIQRVLPGAKIVPIVMGYPERRTVHALSEALFRALEKKKVLIVASTDLSHYLPQDQARAVDTRTISLVQSLNAETIINKMANAENIMCGGGPVAATLLALKKMGKPKVTVLHYADSSAATRDTSQVVGYMAAAVALDPGPSPQEEFSLSARQKKELIQLARSAVNRFVEENKLVEYETQDPDLIAEKGVFVTLRKNGQLRGCIGFIEPVFPLYEAVIRAAVYAATEDPRFRPVAPQELKDIDLEISVLTPPKKIDDPRLVRVGRHGLVISQGERKGLLLPQVAVENNWSREAFLDQACVKAGLAPDAWKKGAEIYVFEALVFD